MVLYFGDDAGGPRQQQRRDENSAITGPGAKERADLWPRIASSAGSIARFSGVFVKQANTKKNKKKKNEKLYPPHPERMNRRDGQLKGSAII